MILTAVCELIDPHPMMGFASSGILGSSITTVDGSEAIAYFVT